MYAEVVVEVVERVGDEVAVVVVGALAQQADQQPVQRERDLLVRGEEVEVVGDQPRQAVDQVRHGVLLHLHWLQCL